MAGMPLMSTRVEVIDQRTVTHGCGLGPGTVNGQPATVIRFAEVATG
jgi:hypothetical protein